MTSRRTFLTTTSRSALGLALARATHRVSRPLSLAALMQGQSPEHLLPPPLPRDLFAKLAAQAMDAARTAGASFADIRLSEAFTLHLGVPIYNPGLPIEASLDTSFYYGIRVIANGATAFVYGSLPDANHIATAAQEAVATALGYAALATTPIELAPAPAATGSWTTPIQVDPFTIPMQDHVDTMYGVIEACGYAQGQNEAYVIADWEKEQRVYASTDGALTTQVLHRVWPTMLPMNKRSSFMDGHVYLPMAGSAGYERIIAPGFADTLKAKAEMAAEISRMPERPLDIGRYPVVLEGSVFGQFFAQTLGQALSLNVALGEAADVDETSCLAPPVEMLGSHLINPLLDVTASRTLPHFHAVKWDDEGVEPEDYTVVKDGVVVDYHTSRQSVMALKDYYQKAGKPLRSHGCALARRASDLVREIMPHLTIAPGRGETSLEDLYRDMDHGLLLIQGPSISVGPGFAGGILGDNQTLEIRRGKIVGRVKQRGIQFSTQRIWKNLTAIGDARTVKDAAWDSWDRLAFQDLHFTATAPAALFKEADVIDISRRY